MFQKYPLFCAIALVSFSANVIASDLIFKEWPIEETKTSGLDYLEETAFSLPHDFQKINIKIQTGQLIIKQSPNDKLHLYLKGEKESVKNIIFSQTAEECKLIDQNEPSKTSSSEVPFIDTMMGGIRIQSYMPENLTIRSSVTPTVVNGQLIENYIEKQMTSSNFAKFHGYISQDELHKKLGGYGMEYGVFQCNDIKLKDIAMGSQGRILSGVIEAGQVEQAGKIYGPGTSFREGIPNEESLNTLSQNSGTQSDKAPPIQKQSTEINLLVPQRDFCRFFIQGSGESKTSIDGLTIGEIEGTFTDTSFFNGKGIISKNLVLKGSNDSKSVCNGNVLGWFAHACNNAEIELTPENPQNPFATLHFEGDNYGKINFNGNGIICNTNFNVNMKNSSESKVQELYVQAKASLIELAQYAKLSFIGSFDTVRAKGQNSSELIIKTGKKAISKSTDENLKCSDLFSQFALSQHAKAHVEDWFNKLIVSAANSAEFVYAHRDSMEAIQILAQQHGKAKIKMTVKRAKIQAQNSAEVFVSKVTDTLDDQVTQHAKIIVDSKPNSSFVF